MRKLKLIFIIVAIGLISAAAKKGMNSSVYEWENLRIKKTKTGEERKFFESSTRSLDMIDVKAVTLLSGDKGNGYQIDDGFNELIIVKEGNIEISVNGDRKVFGEGSVIVASPGDEMYITNPERTAAVYYFIGFKPHKSVVNKEADEDDFETPDPTPPVFINWNEVEFKPSANGGRRSIMQQKTALLKELEIHVTTLKEGLPSHAPHTHADEEIILVRKGFVEETISGKPYRLGPGSIIFLTNDDPHGISNSGKGECEYFAIRWLTVDKKNI
jgi:quercetin dioxygenase-like cupin family protein